MSPLPLLPPAGLLPGTPMSPAVFPPSVLDPTYLSPSSQPFAPCLDPQWGGGQFVCRGSRREGNTDAGTHLSSPGRCSWEEADPHSTLAPQGKPSGCRSQGLLPATRGPQAEAAAPSHPPSQAPSPPLHCRALTQVNAEQTGSPTAPPARITARAQLPAPSCHALWLRAGGRLRAGGSLTLPEAPVCPASHSAPSAHCPPTPTLAKRGGSWARWGPCCPTEDPAWPLPLAGLLPAAQSCPSPSAPGGRCVCLDTVSVP